ncbi:MAG TPA: general stress protein [Candidatus Nanopelagicales bacterium]
MSGALGRRPVGPDVTKRPVLASYDDYLAAQKAVDTLSDKGFPVQNVAIVGVDLRIVEAVMGRLSWGRAAASGLFTGAWFGLLIGLFVSLFVNTDSKNGTGLVLLGLIYGAAFGIVFGLISYAFTRGRRDFVSRQQLQATRYDVLCEQEFIGKARQLLGLGVWPPPLPTVTPAVDAEAAGSDGPTGG